MSSARRKYLRPVRRSCFLRVASGSVPEREQRVTPLELFFDLVFVYAITQVTTLMSEDLTWRGIGHGLLVLAALWWAWTGYAWLTNTLEPEEGLVRAGVFCGMAAMFVAALAVPRAFGRDAALFGVAYVLVRLINLALYGIAGKRDREFRRTVVRFAPTASTGPLIILVAAFVDGGAQTLLWVVAIAALYSGPLIDRGQGWSISPAHFAERYGLIVIIALGESIVAVGLATVGTAPTSEVIAAALLGLAVIAALWWAYFDVIALLAQRQLAAATGVARARLARDGYSYLHMPMIAGIVLFALGLKITAYDGMEALTAVPAVALCGGASLYFWTHVVMRVRLGVPAPSHVVGATGLDRSGPPGGRDRHARDDPGRPGGPRPRRIGAGRGAVLGADPVGRSPLPQGTRRDTPGASVDGRVRIARREGVARLAEALRSTWSGVWNWAGHRRALVLPPQDPTPGGWVNVVKRLGERPLVPGGIRGRVLSLAELEVGGLHQDPGAVLLRPSEVRVHVVHPHRDRMRYLSGSGWPAVMADVTDDHGAVAHVELRAVALSDLESFDEPERRGQPSHGFADVRVDQDRDHRGRRDRSVRLHVAPA
jgi:low temperature requirement protein LtrA